MKIKSIAVTDKGNFRKNNQDFIDYSTNQFGQFLAIVCDGMGGHAHGEIASKMAVETFVTLFNNQDFNGLTKKDVNRWMRLSILKIREVMEEYSYTHPGTTDMGTTLTAVIITENGGFVINIGDSRTYKVGKNNVEQITIDQNLKNETAEKDRIKMNKAGDFPSHFNEVTYWKVLVSALGPSKSMKIDTFYLPNIYGTYMLTTDGVHDYIDDETALEILNSDSKLKVKAKQLIELAKSNLSTDNLSVILVEVSNEQ